MSALALDAVTSSLGYGVYDADTHYYEPYDAFTRHIDPKFRDRAVHSRPDAKGRQRPWFGDQPLRFLTVHPEDIVGAPGSLRDVFEHPNESTTGYSIRAAPMSGRDVPAFMERDARLVFMDEQGIAASLVFPSVGVTVEHEMRHDPPAAMANFVAFNKWLEEDWGLHGRIIGVPLLSLLDIDLAVIELDRVLARGARAIYLRPSPVYGRSPVDPVFDPFWSRIDEAGVPVVMHNSNTSYNELVSVHWGEGPAPKVSDISPLQWYLGMTDRPIADMLAALVLHNLFGRFPNVKVLSIENGSAWLAPLLAQLDHAVALARHGRWLGGSFDDLPSDILKAKLSVSPFPEEDPIALADTLGLERVLFGSDWPHPEGLERPLDFADKLAPLADADVRTVMRGNFARLFGLAP